MEPVRTRIKVCTRQASIKASITLSRMPIVFFRNKVKKYTTAKAINANNMECFVCRKHSEEGILKEIIEFKEAENV